MLLIYIFVFVTFAYLLRKFYDIAKEYYKARKLIPVVNCIAPHQPNANNNLNNAQFNPDMIKHTTIIFTFTVNCFVTFPSIYVNYVNESTKDESAFDLMDEFYLFLIDLLFHVGISIVSPLCLFIRNPDLRKFTIQSIKECFWIVLRVSRFISLQGFEKYFENVAISYKFTTENRSFVRSHLFSCRWKFSQYPIVPSITIAHTNDSQKHLFPPCKGFDILKSQNLALCYII